MSGILKKETEEALRKLGGIRCPNCNESRKIVFLKSLPNIILLKCERCSTAFYFSNGKTTKEELAYLKKLGYSLEPMVLLNKEKKVNYVA